MLHQISANDDVEQTPQGIAVEPADDERDHVQTALYCLEFVAARHGIDLSVEQLKHAHAV